LYYLINSILFIFGGFYLNAYEREEGDWESLNLNRLNPIMPPPLLVPFKIKAIFSKPHPEPFVTMSLENISMYTE